MLADAAAEPLLRQARTLEVVPVHGGRGQAAGVALDGLKGVHIYKILFFPTSMQDLYGILGSLTLVSKYTQPPSSLYIFIRLPPTPGLVRR